MLVVDGVFGITTMVTLVYSSVYSFVRDIDEFNKSKEKIRKLWCMCEYIYCRISIWRSNFMIRTTDFGMNTGWLLNSLLVTTRRKREKAYRGTWAAYLWYIREYKRCSMSKCSQGENSYPILSMLKNRHKSYLTAWWSSGQSVGALLKN